MKSYLLNKIVQSTMLCVFLLPFSKLEAQEKNSYSLTELVDSARHHLPLLLQKQALINSAKAGITDAKNSFLPKLTVGDEVSLAAANDLTGTYLPIGGIIHATSGSIREDNDNRAQTGNIASAYAEYDLVNFGLRSAKTANAVAYANLQQADFDKELYVLKLQIGKLYFNMIKNTYQLHIDQQNMHRYQSVMTIIDALTSSGIKPGVDSSMAKAELSKVKVQYNLHQGTIRQLQQQLGFLTGIDASLIKIDTLQQNDGIKTAALFTNRSDTTANPILNYYSKQQSLYKSAETLVKKSYLPKIILAGGGWVRGSSIQYNDDYRALSTGLGYQRFNYAAGVAVTYDLFNPVHRKNKLSVSRYQTQAVGYELQQQKENLKSAGAQAAEAIAAAEKNLLELPVQLQAATEVYNQKVAQYKAGVIDLIDLTNASFLLYSAQLSYTETLNDWYLANLDKAAATGNLDLFIQTIKK